MSRGSNSNGVRRYNERLVLSTIRRLGGASKADLSRITGLSPQAAVRIVEDLASGDLLVVGERPRRGGDDPAARRLDPGQVPDALMRKTAISERAGETAPSVIDIGRADAARGGSLAPACAAARS